jgi:molybdopterin-guanine dinucleotide biosynthesis protein B
MEKLIAELKRRKYRVGTIKHHSHPGFDIDYSGKDSWRHAQAGSNHVIIAAPDKVAEYWQLDREYSLDELAIHIKNVDIILTEGYRNVGKPTIEVLRASRSSKLISDIDNLLAVTTDIELNLDVPCFDLNDTIGLCDYVEEKIIIPKNIFSMQIQTLRFHMLRRSN